MIISDMSLENIVLLSIAEIVGDFGFKDYARTGGQISLVQGVAGYVGIVYYLIKSLQQGNVLWVNSLWDGVSAVLETAAAYIFLGERLNCWTQYVGIIFIILGMILLHQGGIAF